MPAAAQERQHVMTLTAGMRRARPTRAVFILPGRCLRDISRAREGAKPGFLPARSMANPRGHKSIKKIKYAPACC